MNNEQLDALMAGIAQDAGATLAIYPRPGTSARRIILRETRDHHGTQFEFAQIEDDGTPRVVGHDTGLPVTEFFGTWISAYDLQYAVPAECVARLLASLGASQDDDVLAALRAWHQQLGHYYLSHIGNTAVR
jgi:hypothetical protein